MPILHTLWLLFAATTALAAPKDFRLVLHRSACYGTCPVYTLTIDANGAVTFDGISDTSVFGPHHRVMTPDDMAQLVRAVTAIHFFTLGNYSYGGKCPEFWTDNPGVTITVRMDGHENAYRTITAAGGSPESVNYSTSRT